MAKTIILFLALLFTGATSYFSWTNLNKMKEIRSDIHERERDIDAAVGNIEKTDEMIATTTNRKNAENTRKGQQTGERDGLLGDIAGFKNELPRLESKLSTQQAEIKKYEDAIAELKRFFESMNVNDMEELNDRIKKLANDRVEREKEVAETQALVEGANTANARLEELLSGARGRQMDRSRGIQANTAEATVVAVNQDWGFVIINAGENAGFRGDSQLMVKRGETFVARLNITSISKGQMVADIVTKTVPKGMVVMPGDRVMLVTPNR
jgi:chromosome segregation ATPase